jgi:hypothetical protein
VGSPGKSSSSPPEADGILTVTPDGPEAAEWRARHLQWFKGLSAPV